MSAANRLEQLAKRVFESKRLEHKFRLRELREFIKSQDTQVLCYMISQFNNIEYLRSVWEAGINAECQLALEQRFKELRKKLRETEK